MKRAALIAAAFALDLALGDPASLPHPVRAIGAVTGYGERIALRLARGNARVEALAGIALTAAIVGSSAACAAAILAAVRRIAGPGARAVFEIGLAASALATRDLLAEADAVLAALATGDLSRARQRLARIVGRDTHALEEPEIARATIETLAESLCDGIVAPLCALAAGGVPLAVAFKAASTLDSMIGHIEAPYTYFGRAAAKLDDALCFVPARASAVAIALAAPLVAGGSSSGAWRTLRADGHRHRSPNAGRPEAAMAGALRVRLGGTNFYGGIAHPGDVLGRAFAPPSTRDVRRARAIVLRAAIMFAAAIAAVTTLP